MAAEYLARVQNLPFCGARMSQMFSCYAKYPNLAQFYLVGKTAVLQVTGQTAVLCGAIDNQAELCDLLEMYGITELYCQKAPKALQKFKQTPLYVMAAQDARVCGDNYYIKQIEPRILLDMWGFSNSLAFESTLADLCIRRNHAMADCIGIFCENEILGSCAAMGTDTSEIYLSFVTVKENYRMQGVGSAMLSLLIQKYTGQCLYLECEKEVQNFYLKNGFITVMQRYKLNR